MTWRAPVLWLLILAPMPLLFLGSGCSDDDKTAAASPDAAGPLPKKPSLPQADSGIVACVPGDLPGFVAPSWTPPASFNQGLCTDDKVQQIVTCLFDETSDVETCNAVLDAKENQDCFNCLFTDISSEALGPMIISDGYASLNKGGCIARAEGDVTSTSCGAKYAARALCEEQSCAQNCSTEGENAQAEFDKCQDQAADSICKTFSGPGKCADALLAAGGAAAGCNTKDDTFVAAGIKLGKLFCSGTGPVDGGVDATDGASDATDASDAPPG